MDVSTKAPPMIEPLKQFKLKTLIPLHIAGMNFSFTNASAWMLLASFLICAIGYFATKKHTLVPNKFSYGFELLHDFIADILTNQSGQEARKYLPYVFSLFLFILFSNLLGLLPFSFTTTSHMSVTFTLAMLVFISSIAISVHHNHWKFFRHFCPSGVPIYLTPVLVPIELISYMARPFSLAIRLCANMVAGHIMIKIFASFINLMTSSQALFWGGGLLLMFMNVCLTGFEVLVACLQAYVFTVLTCIYIDHALHLH